MTCPNCGRSILEHECPHLIPCCPGTCPLAGGPPTCAAFRKQLLDEQVWLWFDLDDAVTYAQSPPPVVPGRWSCRCDNTAGRIITNAKLVGPVDWAHVPVDLLLAGIYEKVLHTAGLTWPAIAWDEVRSLYNRNHAGADDAIWVGPPVDLLDVHPHWEPR